MLNDHNRPAPARAAVDFGPPRLDLKSSELFWQSYAAFEQQGLADPAEEARHLLNFLSAGGWGEGELGVSSPLELLEIAQKRKEGVPLEYILERATFMGLIFYCNRNTLIPRQETELLVNVALELIRENSEPARDLTIIDIGTGCGNIAISLALNSESTELLATDISFEALEVAQQNVERFQLQPRVKLFCGDLFWPFCNTGYMGNVDIIVCNPPYIPTGSLANLAPEIIDYEPVVALDAGMFGLDIFQKLITMAPSVLRPQGTLVFEIGAGQEALITRLLKRNKQYENISYYQDEVGTVRVISAQTIG